MLSNMFQKKRKQTHTQRGKQTNKYFPQILSHVRKALCCLQASYFFREEDQFTSDKTRFNGITVTGSQMTSTDVKQLSPFFL